MNKDITFSSKSMMDDFGRVFFMDKKVFRAITEKYRNECISLLNESFFQELMDKGFIPKTQIADFTIANYALVLEHEKLPTTLQHEWTFSMMKKAAQLVLSINDICEKHGYELKDAHTLNVLFRGCAPVYVDIGSFQKRQGNKWCAYHEFISCFYVPLVFWAEGKYYMVRKLLESNFYRMQTIPSQDIMFSGLFQLSHKKIIDYKLCFKNTTIFKSSINFKLNYLSEAINRTISVFMGKKVHVLTYQQNYKDLNFVKKVLEGLTYPQIDSKWKSYHTKYYTTNGQIDISDRFKRILEIINEKCKIEKIESLLDLAGNEGLVSFMMERETPIRQITIADYDENALERAFQIQTDTSSKINIVLLNFMFTPNLEQTAERLKSDIVLALAVTHHLILTSNYTLSTIFERIKSYSSKYVFIEFMPKGLWALGSEIYPQVPDWYHQDWFRVEFERYFEIELEEQLEENRILFVGKIK